MAEDRKNLLLDTDYIKVFREMDDSEKIKFFIDILKETKIMNFVSDNDDYLIFKYEINKHLNFFSNKTITVQFEKSELLKCYSKMENIEIYKDNYYLGNNNYECLLKCKSSFKEEYNVESDELNISLGLVSDELSLALLFKGYFDWKADKCALNDIDVANFGILAIMNEETVNGFEILKESGILSLKIKTKEPKKKEDFRDYHYSYLFDLSMNCNKIFVEFKSNYYNFFRKINNKNIIRQEKEIGIPRKKYIIDIVEYYNNARITADLPSKYLSYYHILEYFFEDVHYENMVNNVRREIKNPEFSLDNYNSVKNFVKFMEENISRKKGENYVLNEKNALGLTINKYITLDDLEKKLQDIDKDLVKYFKNKGCKFSNANKIDFVNSQTIVNRIYKNRNALVHSKNASSERYRPFKDEDILEKEIELIKAIAEMSIINSGEEL